MADITISLSNVHNIKRVHIDEIGDFEVRKMGAGEELDLSDKLRRLNEIIEELSAIDFNKINIAKPTKKDIKSMEALTARADSLMEEINGIKRFELESYARCFNDNNGGKDTKKLLDSLSDEDRAELFKQIFSPAKVLQKPTEPTLPEPATTDTEKVEETAEEKK